MTRKGIKMELNYFKDKMFDLLNDADNMEIRDIVVNDRKNVIMVQLADGSVFALECRRLMSAQKRKTSAAMGNVRVCWMRNRGVK